MPDVAINQINSLHGVGAKLLQGLEKDHNRDLRNKTETVTKLGALLESVSALEIKFKKFTNDPSQTSDIDLQKIRNQLSDKLEVIEEQFKADKDEYYRKNPDAKEGSFHHELADLFSTKETVTIQEAKVILEKLTHMKEKGGNDLEQTNQDINLMVQLMMMLTQILSRIDRPFQDHGANIVAKTGR